MRVLHTAHGNKRRFAVCGALMVVLFLLQVSRSETPDSSLQVPELVPPAHATPVLHRAVRSALHENDPLAYLKNARREYGKRVRDYECTFRKQELIPSGLTADQVANVKFREGPFSVYMHIHKNPGKARRVLYVKDRIVKSGHQYATIEPEGAAWRFLVHSVEKRVDGQEVMRASRKPITDFGFARSLDLIIKYIDMLPDKQAAITYVGEGQIDGRPTYVFERRLPYRSKDDVWPDAVLTVHMDQEWQLPVSCTAYADADKQELLGRYEYSNVQFNIGLRPQDFAPETYGL